MRIILVAMIILATGTSYLICPGGLISRAGHVLRRPRLSFYDYYTDIDITTINHR